MKSVQKGMIALILSTGVFTPGNAEELTQTIFGEGNICIGQLANGSSRYEPPFQHRWLQSNAMILGDSVSSGARMSMKIELLGLVRFSSWVQNQNGLGYIDARLPSSGFYFNEASGTYIFGDPDEKQLSFTLGFFPYKYNQDVKNLGEYLFRSMAYPNYIIANFDQPFARMLGVKFSSRLLGGALRQDLILSNEWEQYPTKDFSLAYVAGYRISPFLDIGIGGQAFHLFSTRGNYTTPDSTRYQPSDEWKEGQWYYASPEDSAADKKTPYTFKGIKLMGRINVHPLANMPEIKLPYVGKLFGDEDLKFYAEADVLGLKDYPAYNPGGQWEYYEKLSERIPVTFGINAPTNPLFAYGIIPMAVFLFGEDPYMFKKLDHEFQYSYDSLSVPPHWDTALVDVRVKDFSKRLIWSAGSAVATAAALFVQNKFGINVRPDILGFEFEYWTNRYPNSWENIYRLYIPAPEFDRKSRTYEHNRWRWSVFATKRMGNFFAKLQVAHDHMVAYQTQLFQVGTVDNLGAAGYWWWTLKTGYQF